MGAAAGEAGVSMADRGDIPRATRTAPAVPSTVVAAGDESAWGRRLAWLTFLCLVALVVAALGDRQGWPWPAVVALYLLAYACGGYSGVVNGWASLRLGHLDVNVLMLVAAAGAATIGHWLEGGILLFLFSLSETLQVFALGRTRQAVRALMSLRPDEAWLDAPEGPRRVAVEALAVGDVVQVRPGERVPADGWVLAGQSDVDQAPITGESVPVHKREGAEVFAGTINGSGLLQVRVSRLAAESALARIITLVSEAQSARAPTQRVIDEFGDRYARFVIGGAALMFFLPPFLLDWPWDEALHRSMTLLVVASPCALVISTPAAYLSAIANAARHGVLFKGGAFLEAAAGVQTVALDKTGTLTRGRPVVTDVVALVEMATDEILTLAAAVERHSEHHLGRAVVAAAAARGLALPEASAVQAVPGLGIRARVNGDLLSVGKLELLRDGAAGARSRPVDDSCAALDASALVREFEVAGKTAVVVGNERPLGVLALADEIRPEAAPTIAALRRAGIGRVAMVSGDNALVAHEVARAVGIHPGDVHAGLLPAEKVAVVRQLAASGPVSFVGDGVNDAPALATSSLGVAMGGGGTDVALETADVVLMGDRLEQLGHVFGLGRAARRVVKQNVAFSVGVIVVLVAATVLHGIPLPLGVVGHEGSTLLVVLNGLRLLGFRGWSPSA